MNRRLVTAIFLLGAVLSVRADVDPVAVEVPVPKADVGQRLPFYVELRSAGSFSGAASFTLPEVSQTVILKVGNPVVSSEQIEGTSWFVQRHEFAIFSQQAGTVQIPEFPVHFGRSEGFTGPSTEVKSNVPGFSVEIERPPGTDPKRFLVTTASLSIEERWEPRPGGDVKPGTVFKRTITQNAKDMTGMALAPAPTNAPDGIRVYAGKAEVTDETERGVLSGQRRETLTYLVEQPGQFTLPAIRYDWWNPKTNQLESKTLSELSFTAQTPPGTELRKAWTDHPVTIMVGLLFFVVLVALVVLAYWKRQALRRAATRLHDHCDPPEHRMARSLLQACRRNNAQAAERAWTSWELMNPGFKPSGDLQMRLLELHRYFYGDRPSPKSWSGMALAAAFRSQLLTDTKQSSLSALPPLNP